MDVGDGELPGGVLAAFGVGLSDRLASFDAAPGDGQAVAVGPVVAAPGEVDGGGAAELPGAEDDGPG